MKSEFRIAEIITEEIKGGSGRVKVGPLTLLIGPNGSGKTRELVAARLAATGQSDLGKSLEKNIALFGPNGGGAGFKLTEGFEFVRRVRKDNYENKLKESIQIVGRDTKGVGDAETIVKEKIGDFAPMWGVGSFLEMSTDKRRAFILELCSRACPSHGEVDAKDLLAWAALEALKIDEKVGPAAINSEIFRRYELVDDGPNIPRPRTAVEKLAPENRKAFASEMVSRHLKELEYAAFSQAVSEILPSVQGDLAEGVAAAIDQCGELIKASDRDEKEARAAIRSNSDRMQEFNNIAGDLAEMQTLQGNHEVEEKAIIQKIGQAEGREGSETSTRARIESIDRDVLAAQTAVREIEALPAVPDDRDAEHGAKTAEINIGGLNQRFDAAKAKESELQGACDRARAALATAQAGASLVEQTKASIDSLKHQIGNAEQAIIGLESVKNEESAEEREDLAKELQAANPKPENNTTSLRTLQADAVQDERKAFGVIGGLESDLATLHRQRDETVTNPWAQIRKLWLDFDSAIDITGWSGEATAAYDKLHGFIKERSGQVKSLVDLTNSIEEKKREIQAATAAYASAVKIRESSDNAIQAAERGYQEKWAAYQKSQEEVQRLFARAAKLKNEAEIRAASLKSARERKDRLDAELKDKSDALGKLGGPDGDIKGLQTASTNASVAMHRHRGEMDSIREEISGHEKKIAELRKSLETNQAERTRRTSEIARLNQQIAGLQTQRTEAVCALETLTDSRKGDDLAALRGRRVNIETAIAEVKAKIEKKTRFDLLKQEFDAANLKAENQRIYHDCCKALVKALKVIRETIMRERVEPVVSRMDRFLEAAMPGTRAFCDLINDLDRDDFALGWKRGDLKVTLPALSGGERAIFQAALLYALVTLANPPLRLLLIEAAEVDGENLLSLIKGCESVADELSNIFIATYYPGIPQAIPNWTVIKASRKEFHFDETQNVGRFAKIEPDAEFVEYVEAATGGKVVRS
jgi:hypothetical protein